MSSGQTVLVVALLLAAAFGIYRGFVDGRFGGTHRVRGVTSDQPEPGYDARIPVLADTEHAEDIGSFATLLQFSSTFCAPCRVARRVLAEVAASTPGVVHLEIDAEHHLELVRRLGVQRTPTTLVLDAEGHEVTRAAGAPTAVQVRAALAMLD